MQNYATSVKAECPTCCFIDHKGSAKPGSHGGAIRLCGQGMGRAVYCGSNDGESAMLCLRTT